MKASKYPITAKKIRGDIFLKAEDLVIFIDLLRGDKLIDSFTADDILLYLSQNFEDAMFS